MKKGISPIVAVVLLIAIAVIAAVGLYFWVGGLATQQPTPDQPGTISAVCQGGVLIISNTSPEGTSITGTDLSVSSSQTVTEAGSGVTNYCDGETMESGESCVFAVSVSGGTSGSIFGAQVGAAKFSC